MELGFIIMGWLGILTYLLLIFTANKQANKTHYPLK